MVVLLMRLIMSATKMTMALFHATPTNWSVSWGNLTCWLDTTLTQSVGPHWSCWWSVLLYAPVDSMPCGVCSLILYHSHQDRMRSACIKYEFIGIQIWLSKEMSRTLQILFCWKKDSLCLILFSPNKSRVALVSLKKGLIKKRVLLSNVTLVVDLYASKSELIVMAMRFKYCDMFG